MFATSVAVWALKLDFDQLSNDAAEILSKRDGKEGFEVAKTSFQLGCCCITGIAICEICGVGAEA